MKEELLEIGRAVEEGRGFEVRVNFCTCNQSLFGENPISVRRFQVATQQGYDAARPGGPDESIQGDLFLLGGALIAQETWLTASPITSPSKCRHCERLLPTEDAFCGSDLCCALEIRPGAPPLGELLKAKVRDSRGRSICLMRAASLFSAGDLYKRLVELMMLDYAYCEARAACALVITRCQPSGKSLLRIPLDFEHGREAVMAGIEKALREDVFIKSAIDGAFAGRSMCERPKEANPALVL